MVLYEKHIEITTPRKGSTLESIKDAILRQLGNEEVPLRFVVTKSNDSTWECEVGVLTERDDYAKELQSDHIFVVNRRSRETTTSFNTALIIPTGVDAAIGGHAGDAGPVARLLASSSDTLITHPNVVNASDINELPENGLYVEGSVLTRLLMGTVGLQPVRANRVLVVLDKHQDAFFYEAAINSISAARASMGLTCPGVVLMDKPISMKSLYSPSGRAVGSITHFERLSDVLESYRGQYDAVALSSVIGVPPECHEQYFKTEMINPWGGVEAMLTHAVSSLYDIPSAHSPMLEEREILNLDVGVVDPRKAAEAVSTTFLHCILRGLAKSPRIVAQPAMQQQNDVLSARDVSCLVIPDGCLGLPVLAALEQGIPVIAVRENTNRMQNALTDLSWAPGQLHIVESYLEAVGVMQSLKAGIAIDSVRRPMEQTQILDQSQDATSIAGDRPLKSNAPAANRQRETGT